MQSFDSTCSKWRPFVWPRGDRNAATADAHHCSESSNFCCSVSPPCCWLWWDPCVNPSTYPLRNKRSLPDALELFFTSPPALLLLLPFLMSRLSDNSRCFCFCASCNWKYWYVSDKAMSTQKLTQNLSSWFVWLLTLEAWRWALCSAFTSPTPGT